MKFPYIDNILRVSALATLLGSVFMTVSCASDEEFQNRMDERTDTYSGLQNRRQMRQDARQERTDAWFDRVMH